MSSRPERVVSLLPSATEIVCALGALDRLVGISHECDFPAEVRGRKVLTRPRIQVDGSSRTIDEAVRAVIRDALSIYELDERALSAIAPDLIVTQDLCEVCAVSLNDVRSAVARLAHRSRVEIVSLRPTRLEHVLGDIKRVALALGEVGRGRALRASLDERIHDIATRAARASSRPRVASIEWLEPLMLGGTWMPQLIELAGGSAVGALPGDPAPTLSAQSLFELEPELIILKPCGLSLERTLGERDLIERSILARASPSTRIYVTDGNAFFNRPGPRLVESLEILAAALHPELFADFAAKHAAVLTTIQSSERSR